MIPSAPNFFKNFKNQPASRIIFACSDCKTHLEDSVDLADQ